MQKRYQDSTPVTIGAVIVYFHAPHGTTNDEILYLRPDRKKVFDVLVESLPADWAGHPGDALRTNSSRVHHPENPELFGTIDTPGARNSDYARSRTAAAPETVTCLMPRFSALPKSKSQEVGGDGQPWLKRFPSPSAACYPSPFKALWRSGPPRSQLYSDSPRGVGSV